MKKKILIWLLIILAGFAGYYVYNKYFNKTEPVCENKNTEVFVINQSKDTVVVFLTIGADTNFVTDVNGIFGITTNGLQGSFILNPNDTVSYQSPCGKGFGGNITFGTAPVNCPDTNLYPYGINLFEFALNDNFVGTSDAQETVDISCVAGVNSRIICNLSDANWNDGDSTGIKTFENSYLYDNVFRIGVFPFGCDSCTVIKNPPACAGHKPFSQPQKKNICNVQRDADKNGGSVYVQFGGYLKGEINSK
jgi:hypothetical protein